MDQTLSAALIVKNEERFLPDCLGSIKGLATEIIVVDTGSTDSTKAIAEKHQAKIFDLPWQGDFSAARNFAIAQCTSDWILIIDADEQIAPDDKKIILPLISSGEVEAYFCQVIDVITGNGHPSLRLWKRSTGIIYEGKIHELPALKGHKSAYSDFKIKHFGYHSPENNESSRLKHDRNIGILKKSLSADPANVELLFHMGLEYEEAGNIDEAIAFYKKAHDLAPGLGSPIIFRSLAMALQKKGQFAEALKLLEEGIKRFPDYNDLHYLSGSALQRIGKDEEAISFFVKCVDMGRPPLSYPSMGGVSDFLPLRGIGISLLNLGRLEQAEKVLEDAIKFMPSDKFTLDILEKIKTRAAGATES